MFDLYITNPQLQQESTHVTNESLQVFLEHLESRGYVTKTIHDYLGAVLHFSRWQRQKDKTLSETTSDHVTEFVEGHLHHCHCPRYFPRNKKRLLLLYIAGPTSLAYKPKYPFWQMMPSNWSWNLTIILPA